MKIQNTMENNCLQSSNKNDLTWDLYNLLSNTLQHYHSRWVDNYKIFLSFNSFLLPGATALLGYALKENLLPLRFFTTLLCVVGIMASWLGFRLLQRIRVDTDLRLNQLVRLERSMDWLPLKPFSEGKDFFFHNKNLTDDIDDNSFCQDRYKNKGTRGIEAYKYISIAIIICYLIIGLYGIWPLIDSSTIFCS
jgi:hypothetical protein